MSRYVGIKHWEATDPAFSRRLDPEQGTMYWIILAAVCGVGLGAKLDNKYLPPPPGAKEAGGDGDSLQVPLEPPYIDPYSDPVPVNTKHGRQFVKGRSYNNVQVDPASRTFVDQEDQIRPVKESSFEKSKGRFLSGSYSYTGPDNVLVTVTYKADDRQGRKLQEDEDESRGYHHQEEEEDQQDGVVPTPSSLPEELQKAFEFHKKHGAEAEKKSRGYKYPKPTDQGQKQDQPQVHQGYSYPQAT